MREDTREVPDVLVLSFIWVILIDAYTFEKKFTHKIYTFNFILYFTFKIYKN